VSQPPPLCFWYQLSIFHQLVFLETIANMVIVPKKTCLCIINSWYLTLLCLGFAIIFLHSFFCILFYTKLFFSCFCYWSFNARGLSFHSEYMICDDGTHCGRLFNMEPCSLSGILSYRRTVEDKAWKASPASSIVSIVIRTTHQSSIIMSPRSLTSNINVNNKLLKNTKRSRVWPKPTKPVCLNDLTCAS